jgi:hypothetical protein
MQIVRTIFLLAAVASAIPVSGKEPQNHFKPATVNYCDLLNHPSTYAGKMIRVRAIYEYSSEIQRLEGLESCSVSGSRIWVDFGLLDEHSLKQLNLAPRDAGSLLGVFVGEFETRGKYGDGRYAFRFTVFSIDKIENAKRASKF